MSRLFGNPDCISQHILSLGDMFEAKIIGAYMINTREVRPREIDMYSFRHVVYKSRAFPKRYGTIVEAVRNGIWTVSDLINENALAKTFYKPPKDIIDPSECVEATQVYLPPLNPLLTATVLREDMVTFVRLDVLVITTAELYKCVCDPEYRFKYGCDCMTSPGFDLTDLPWFGGKD